MQNKTKEQHEEAIRLLHHFGTKGSRLLQLAAQRVEDEVKIRQIIGDTWGHRTHMVEVPRG